MAGKIPEEILEEARKLIGAESAPVRSRYPVEYDSIRRYCHMTGDDNPLFLDPEYAATTEFGSVIAPPFFIRNMSGPGPWPKQAESQEGRLPPVPTAGNRTINLTTEFEMFEPVRVGDRIIRNERIADIYIKAIRLDPKAFWTVTETVFRNQHGTVVMVARNIGLRHRSPEEVKAAGDA
ncbi:MAG: MaoC family dehydratase N-terminal domain-containing protein [Chloroflexi bacterium]|nr:MaoC family dehydratase N-terminal domain-containing protein [Chloroflexota bacterium]